MPTQFCCSRKCPVQIVMHGVIIVQHRVLQSCLKPVLPSLQNRTEDEAYLGNLGPIVRAAVGDRILFHFLNRLKMPVSVHPHGVFYNKSSEGALYSDGTSGILSIPLPYALRSGKPCWLRACIE